MFQRDYILRLVEQLAQALDRIVRRRAAGEEDRADEELQAIARSAFGTPLELLASLPEDELMRIIERDSRPDFERLALLARLFWERSLATVKPREDEPRWARKSLRLLSALGERNGGRALGPHREALLALVGSFEQASPTPSVQHDLWLACEALGLFARAEDKLYALDDSEPRLHAREGEAFYRRLLAREDDELDAGGLPRDEVEDGLSRWMERERREA